MEVRRIRVALLAMALLGGCKGYVASDHPLLTQQNAEFPLASGTGISGWTLGDDKVWERDEHTARLVVIDGSYRLFEPGSAEAGTDRLLVRRIGRDEFVVQASNGSTWAYGLIVRADMYYLFTFNRGEENCTKLSTEERARFRTIVQDDVCYVGNSQDLVGLLRYLRQKFPYPTSAFVTDGGSRSDAVP